MNFTEIFILIFSGVVLGISVGCINNDGKMELSSYNRTIVYGTISVVFAISTFLKIVFA